MGSDGSWIHDYAARVASRLAVIWLLLVATAALLAPWLSSNSATQALFEPLAPPAGGLPLGADSLGRDFLARLLYGARLSLVLSFLAAAVAVLVGGVAGFSASVVGGRFEGAINWLSNVLLAIPGLLLAMLFVAALGPSVAAVVLAVGIGLAPGFGRVTRSVVSGVLKEGYVIAAQASGAGAIWISTQHLLPNSLPRLGSYATTYFAWSFLAVTTLTFLGLAGDPSIPEWGAMLNAGRIHLRLAPWLSAAPAAAICLTILAVHSIAKRSP